MTLDHMAGIIAVEETRNVRKRKPRIRWKDPTAVKVDCYSIISPTTAHT
jgi:hypothetical protein